MTLPPEQSEALLELAGRVEAFDPSSAAGHGLNADILRALGWTSSEGRAIRPDGQPSMTVPYYLGSLDASMTLVPEDWNVTLRGVDDSWHVALNATSFGPLRQSFGFARSAALAIAAAALRARALALQPVGE